jgi:hypothetical protein
MQLGILLIFLSVFSIVWSQIYLRKSDPNLSQRSQNDLVSDFSEYEKVRKRIFDLSNARDLYRLVELQKEVEETWGKTQPIDIWGRNLYAGLMFTVCSNLGSQDFDNDEQYPLTRKCVKKALESRDKMLVWQETDLVSFFNPRHEYLYLKLINQEQWEKERKEAVESWMHAWQRLDKEVDEKYDFEANRPKRYSNLKTEEKAKAEKYQWQLKVKDVQKSFSIEFRRFLVSAYATIPYNTPELEGFLNKYVKDVGMRKSILAEVEQKILENQREKQNQ